MTIAVPRRELNRVHTWEALHSTASALVLARGLADVTVDEIADKANVSRRTFFNYFATKEDAVLGTQPPSLSAEALEAFQASTDDLFGRVVRLMTAAVQSAFDDLAQFSTRRRLLKRNPELRTRIEEHVRAAESLVQQQLTAIGVADDEDSRALLILAASVMRFAFAPRDDGSIDVSAQTIDSAIERFRHVMKEAL